MNMRTIVEESPSNIAVMDVFSKLIQERIIFIDGEIDEELANGVIAQLLYLNSIDSKEVINVYINTPGGLVSQGLAIYDVSKIISAPIRTVCIGQAASMGAILMLMGKQRCGTTHSQIMLHQLSGGTIGNLTEMKITVEHAETLQKWLDNIIKEKTLIENPREFMLFDKWLDSKQAKELGILTEIL